jgi:hypothetical protein
MIYAPFSEVSNWLYVFIRKSGLIACIRILADSTLPPLPCINMNNLPLQIRNFNGITLYYSSSSDTGSGKIHKNWQANSPQQLRQSPGQQEVFSDPSYRFLQALYCVCIVPAVQNSDLPLISNPDNPE